MIKKPLNINSIVKGVAISALAIIIGAGIVGSIAMYGTVQRIDERTKDFPSVNGLIITQNDLQNKLDIKDHNDFMKMFCKFVEEQKIRERKQDSINKALLKLIKIRGLEIGNDTFQNSSWIGIGKRICKHC
jgi:hypothetical protein